MICGLGSSTSIEPVKSSQPEEFSPPPTHTNTPHLTVRTISRPHMSLGCVAGVSFDAQDTMRRARTTSVSTRPVDTPCLARVPLSIDGRVERGLSRPSVSLGVQAVAVGSGYVGRAFLACPKGFMCMIHMYAVFHRIDLPTLGCIQGPSYTPNAPCGPCTKNHQMSTILQHGKSQDAT